MGQQQVTQVSELYWQGERDFYFVGSHFGDLPNFYEPKCKYR